MKIKIIINLKTEMLYSDWLTLKFKNQVKTLDISFVSLILEIGIY